MSIKCVHPVAQFFNSHRLTQQFLMMNIMLSTTPSVIAALLFLPAVFSTEPQDEYHKTSLESTINVTTCFDNLGCLSTTDEWYGPARRVNLRPFHPKEIATNFRLYTRKNLAGEPIHVGSDRTVASDFFQPDRDTKFIIHGYLENGNVSWVLGIKQALLSRVDINVITVDYSEGAHFPYHRAIANARVVGMEIAYLINAIIKTRGVLAETFHLIGHSLGGHVAGYAGERVEGLGRITGLDPAGPQFNDMPTIVRLDTTDAQFVDVIHTDAKLLGYGYIEPLGHIDFYPNNGKDQPGCHDPHRLFFDPRGFLYVIGELPTCSHARSVKLFLSSIIHSPVFGEVENNGENNCPFIGFHCKSYEHFEEGCCVSCGSDGMDCALMGIDADKYLEKGIQFNVGKKFYLSTTDLDPYCGYHYALNMTIASESNGRDKIKGEITVNAYGNEGSTMNMKLKDKNEYSKGKTYHFLAFSNINVGHIASAEITWKWSSNSIIRDDCIHCSNNLFLSDAEWVNLGYYPASKFKKSYLCSDEKATELKSSSRTILSFTC